jgi:hypothetical protein
MRLRAVVGALLLAVGLSLGQVDLSQGQVALGPGDTLHTLVSNLTLRHWALEYREYKTEFLECLYGDVHGDTARIHYSIAADVKPSHSRASSVTPQEAGQCEITGDSIIGLAHNHPSTCAPMESACGLQKDSNSMHPQEGDLCYESFPDMRTFVATGLEVNVVVCGVGRIYLQRKGSRPNNPMDICSYNPEADDPEITCGGTK